MGNTTYSGPIRAGKKPYLAGVAKLTLAVDSSTAGVVGSLPPNCVVLGAVSNQNGVVANVSDTVTTAVLTTVTAGVAINIVPTLIAGPGDITITGNVADSILYIEYVIKDIALGVNN